MLNSRQLKQLRLQQELSQEQIRNVLGVSKNYISMLEMKGSGRMLGIRLSYL